MATDVSDQCSNQLSYISICGDGGIRTLVQSNFRCTSFTSLVLILSAPYFDRFLGEVYDEWSTHPHNALLTWLTSIRSVLGPTEVVSVPPVHVEVGQPCVHLSVPR